MIRGVVLLLVLGAGCSTPSVPTVSIPQRPAPVALVSVDSLRLHHFTYQWLQARAKVSVVYNGKNTDFTAQLRARADSIIWISLQALGGLEAARMLLTPDSVHLIDRIGKQHMHADVDYFRQLTGLPLSFRHFQDLIAGNHLRAAAWYRLRRYDTLSTASAAGSITDSIIFSDDGKLLVQVLSSPEQGQLSIVNQQYTIQDTKPFALWRKWMLRGSDTVEVQVIFTRIKLDEAFEFPFRVEN
ncbi:MAG: DUF4292 domain-containing protein [Chitinophagales bacterium]|nr:DUF4292 domain-containing protein [Chitinophagales bacterium]MDW8427803.1 DUF4292 domain-containing protein [Chitinophagales bacterium]